METNAHPFPPQVTRHRMPCLCDCSPSGPCSFPREHTATKAPPDEAGLVGRWIGHVTFHLVGQDLQEVREIAANLLQRRAR
jgi:hypothetical protein